MYKVKCGLDRLKEANKTERQMKKLKDELEKAFPDIFIKDVSEFYGEGDEWRGLWTGFGESQYCDHYNAYVDPKLMDILNKFGAYIEPYDPGTMMIYPA